MTDEESRCPKRETKKSGRGSSHDPSVFGLTHSRCRRTHAHCAHSTHHACRLPRARPRARRDRRRRRRPAPRAASGTSSSAAACCSAGSCSPTLVLPAADIGLRDGQSQHLQVQPWKKKKMSSRGGQGGGGFGAVPEGVTTGASSFPTEPWSGDRPVIRAPPHRYSSSAGLEPREKTNSMRKAGPVRTTYFVGSAEF